MENGLVDTFCDSLGRVEVSWTRTSWSDVSTALSDAVDPPVIAAPWPFDDEPPGWEELPSAGKAASLEPVTTGITGAVLAVADYGSVVLQHDGATEMVSLLPERHVAVLRASDVVPDMPAAFARLGPLLRESPTNVILATGPSATADMGALVRGAHGPRTVHIIIIDDH